MDAYIDTDEVQSGINSISSSIITLNELTSMMISRLNKAGEEFNSINFARASDSVGKATDCVDDMDAKLEMTKKYLRQLVEIIEEYSSFKF